MKKYLEKVRRSGLNKPKYLQDQEFLLLGAPLLDFLIEDTEKIGRQKYPKLEELELYQRRRGLNLEMLEQSKAQEITCGVSSNSEVLEIHEWITEMYKLDQCIFRSRVICMDMDDVKKTFYDNLRMSGEF